MKEIIIDTVVDSLKLIPFLFIAFLIIELCEHKFSNKHQKIMSKSGKLGPIIAALLGALPQCGFSVMATNLYVTRIITLGTLVSVYLSTSDEMLPILISENVDTIIIFKLIGMKVLLGMFYGLLIDFVLRKRSKNKEDFELCQDEKCDCEHHLLRSVISHTFKTLFFIFLVTIVLNTLFHYFGTEFLDETITSNGLVSPLIASLFGLIPNCAGSIMLTELYIKGVLSAGSTIAGLLTGSGVGLLVLFKQNKNLKENIIILILLYVLGALSGIIINLFGIVI